MDPRRHLLRNAWITLLASIAFAAVLAIPGRAGANTFAYGTIGPIAGPAALGIGSGAHTLGAFTDTWTFTVAGTTPTDDFYLGAEVLNGNSSGVTFSTVTLTNWTGTSVINPTNFSLPLTTGLVAPGAYTLTVGGTATAGGFYVAAVNFNNAAPIPEPETYAMMLAGLGLMGFVARRRKSGRLLA